MADAQLSRRVRERADAHEPEGPPTTSPGVTPAQQRRRDEELWKAFDSERQRQLAQYDRPAGLIFLVMHAWAAWRMYSTHQIDPFQGVYTAWLLSMVLLVVVVADSSNHPEYLPKRRAVLSVMRIAAAYSPVFRAHARFMMKDVQADVKAPWGLLRALFRILYGDHASLLAFMCLGWHVDGLLEAGVQAAMLAVVMTDNAAVCSMPYLESLTSAAGLDDLHRWLQAGSRLLHLPVHQVFYHLSPKEVCTLYMSAIQVLCGCLAPMLYQYCHTAGRAVSFAARRGISAGSPRLRWARFVHDRLCAATLLQFAVRLLVVLPVAAGVVVLLSDILPAEFLPAPKLLLGGG